MNQADAQAFFELLDITYDIIGVGANKIISPAAKAVFFEDLERYPLELVRASLAAHRSDPERGKFTPKPADIIYQIERRRKVSWLSADEAWAQVPKTEGQPAMMNDVTAQALVVAQPFLTMARPDMQAARMAFKGCYERLVERAKLERRGPVYFVSPGGSYEEQQAVLEEGVRQGLLPAPAAQTPLLEQEKRTPGAKPDLKALLLSMNNKAMPPPEAQDYD